MNRKERQEARRAALASPVVHTALELEQTATRAEAQAEQLEVTAEQLEVTAEQLEVTAEQLEVTAEQLEAPAPAEQAEQLEAPAPAEQAEQLEAPAEQADQINMVNHVRALEVVHLFRSAGVILRTAAGIAEHLPGLGSFEQGADILSARCTTAADQLQTKVMQ